MPGRIVHFELVAADADRASRILERALRLERRRKRHGRVRLPDVRPRRRPGRRDLPAQEGQSAGAPIVYFDTEDIEASIAKVRELGGTADDKQPVPTHGWFAGVQGHGGQRLQPLAGRRERRLSGLAVALAVLGGLAGSVQVAVMGRFGGRVGVLEALAFSTAIQLACLARRPGRPSRGGRDRRAAARRQHARLDVDRRPDGLHGRHARSRSRSRGSARPRRSGS